MFEVYLERASQLSAARNLVQDDPPYASAIALLSVHTAIALNDALLMKLGCNSSKGDDHMVSVRETAKRCRAKGLDHSGVEQLRTLVSAKSKVSYGNKPVSFDFATVLSLASQRFEVWAYKRLKEVA
ncbi:MAG: hypothetical protein ACYCSN_16370 [Acidobacteriaceae bacterium]